MKGTSYLLLTCILLAPASFGTGHEACLRCHRGVDEIRKMNDETIIAALKDTGIRSHSRYSDLSDEQLQEIIAALR